MAKPERAPGFRRCFKVTPSPGCVRSEVEDDFHRMSVDIRHNGVTASAVKASLHRAPWSTCPGAVGKCERTFTGLDLNAFAGRGADKAANCTHLYDLAVLAAEHALDEVPLVCDIHVSDPVDGRRHAELWRNGELVMEWWDRDYRIVEPAALAGMKLGEMRSWIDSLDPVLQEAARMLRWAALIAHGRIIPLEQQSDASRMPPSCYTFQPEQAAHARRLGRTREFDGGAAQPLQFAEETA